MTPLWIKNARVIDPAAMSPQDGDGRVRVLRTTT